MDNVTCAETFKKPWCTHGTNQGCGTPASVSLFQKLLTPDPAPISPATIWHPQNAAPWADVPLASPLLHHWCHGVTYVSKTKKWNLQKSAGGGGA